MTSDEVKALVESCIAGAAVEIVPDQPGDVVVFRIETPFWNFLIEQQIAIFAYFKEDENLLQFSDRGLYSFCVEDRSNLNLKRHRNFVKSNGHLIMGSETEEGAFVVNTMTVDVTAEDLDLTSIVGHYLSLLLYCGEV